MKQGNVKDYIFKHISTCTSYLPQLKVYYIFFHPKKPWNLLSSKYMRKCIPYFFVCFIITIQLPSTSLKRELQFLSVSEMGIFYTLALNLKDWPFGIIASRHFRLISGYLNELYCKTIDKTLKTLLSEGSSSILRSMIPELWTLLAFE